MTEYREIGAKIGFFIKSNNPTSQQIQGLLGDLLAGDEILPAMRLVVSGESFSAFHNLIMSGTGALQRAALLQELERTYLPSIVSSIGQIVGGMLDLEVDESHQLCPHSNKSSNYIDYRRTNDVGDYGSATHALAENCFLEEQDEMFDVYRNEGSLDEDCESQAGWSWDTASSEWNKQEEEHLLSSVHFTDTRSRSIAIQILASELKTPIGFLVQWCNKSAFTGTRWIGPDSMLSHEEARHVLQNYKRPSRLIQSILPAIILIVILAFAALLIAQLFLF